MSTLSPNQPAPSSFLHEVSLGEHDQLPSIEDIRTQAVKTRKQGKCCARVRICFIVLAVLVIILGCTLLGVTVKKNRSAASRDDSPTEPIIDLTVAQTQRLNEVVVFLEDYSDPNELHADGSPQSMAARWVALTDPKQLPVNGHRFLQRYALMALYYATTGENWLYDVNYGNPKRDECHWSRDFHISASRSFSLGVVACDSDDQVTSLALEGNDLAGQLPAELSLLTKLERLSLDYNGLTGSIPDSLHTMTQLTSLSLSYNDFATKVPHWLGNLKNLEVLALNNNNFHSTIPTDLHRLTSLTFLGLQKNELKGSIHAVANMTTLEQVYLQENQFTGSLSNTFLSKLVALKKLDASDNKMKGSVPRGLFHHVALESLDLHGNELTGKLPGDFPSSDTLKVLRLQSNQITGSIPTSISNLINLEHLDVSRNQLTGAIPTTLAAVVNMTYLFLSDNPFTPLAIPPLLNSMSKLVQLSLKSTKRTGNIPHWLGDLTKLVMLDLDGNNLSGAVPSQISKISNLELLLLNDNKLTGELPSELWDLHHLETLLVDNNSLVGSAGGFCNLQIVTFAANCDSFECPCCTHCCPSDQCNEEYLTELGTFYRENDYERRTSQPLV